MFLNAIKRTVLGAALAFSVVGGGVAKAQDIVDIAAGDERFTTLVAAVQAAGLVDTLKSPGPFTVFAPTNDAFADLPPGTVESLLEPENRGQLTDILLYHVDDRRLTAGMLPHRTIPIRPVKSDDVICITSRRGAVTLADSTGDVANVIIADIRASNGVIHVIDKVLIPGRKRCGH